MIELRDITKELLQVGRRLSKGADELFKLAKEKAEAERSYRQTLCWMKYFLSEEARRGGEGAQK